MVLPPTHPVTRLERVVQQLRSFGTLHLSELETLASDVEAGQPELARRIRVFAQMQNDESQLVIDELVDIRRELVGEDHATSPAVEAALLGADPAVDSPKRARWLAEQADRDEQLRRPRSRRQLLGGIPHPPPSVPPTPEI